MTYLDIARSIEVTTKETKEVLTSSTDGRDANVRGYERNEFDEKTPALLTTQDAELLKAEIVAAATVGSAEFDRDAYDALWARWNAHEAAGGAP